MANITVTFTITEFCLHTGVTEEELNEIVGLGVIEPYEDDNADWQFDDRAATWYNARYAYARSWRSTGLGSRSR